MVSMKDIAKQCHVSIASVSKALNGYSDIGEDTRNLIIRTAHEMGYLPNSSARALATKPLVVMVSLPLTRAAASAAEITFTFSISTFSFI